jgi:hypothetical protein
VTFHEQYAVAAAATLAVEIPVVLLIARHLRLLVPPARVIGAAVLANALTHPALWYVPHCWVPAAFRPENYGLYLVIGEGAVLVVETLVYWLVLARHRPWLAIAASALANAASYAAGVALWAVIR